MRTAIINRIGGIVLAGGLSTRMGEQDKCLLDLAGNSLISHVLERLRPQVDSLIINANGDPERFAGFDVPIVPDSVTGYAGPLAGLLAGMQWFSGSDQEITHVLTVAGDTPFFPSDLAARLSTELPGEPDGLALAYYDGQRHPTFGLWPISLMEDLHHFLTVEDNRKIMMLVERYPCAKIDFADKATGADMADPFFNVNTPQDLEQARELVGAVSDA